MTKLAQVISIIFLISISLIITRGVYAEFNDLTVPEPINQLTTYNSQPTTNYPSITFGDLLNNSSISSSQEILVATDDAQLASKTAQIRKLLEYMEASYQASLAEFQSKQQHLPFSDYSTNNQQLITNNQLYPTPYIPIPDLIEGVSELADLSAQNPQPKTIYPTPTLTDSLLLATLNNPSIPSFQTTTHNPQPTTNILGSLTQNPVKTSYTIALLGDSMTDTLGRDLPNLKNLLKSNFPNYTFSLLNYGQGSTNLDSGLYRLTNATNYLGTDYPPLLSLKPDILVVESFAYNHWSGEKYDLDRQWLTIAKIIDTVKEKSPDTKIILAATIAPNKDIFGDGVLNWSSAMKENSSLITKAYLQNMVNFASSEHYPLADAYHPTLDSSGNGLEIYINHGDHLHPSPEGALLYSQKIVEEITKNVNIN